MKAFSFIKKGATFVAKPLTWAIGAKSIRENNEVIYSQIRSLRLPRCPDCHKGTLLPHEFADENKTQWECNQCHWFIKISGDANNLSAIHNACQNIEKDNATSMFNDSAQQARLSSVCKRFIGVSRAAYTFSMVLLFTSLYFFLFSHSTAAYLSALSIGVYFFTLGLTNAYRAWQITTKTIYQDGSFATWLKGLKWFV